jgi:hypothetical protein
MSVIFQWLERIGLGYAVPHFQAAGITTPQQLAAIEMAEGAADRLNIANGAYAGGAPLRRNRARRREGESLARFSHLHPPSLSPQRTTRSACGSSSTAFARCVHNCPPCRTGDHGR